MMDLKMPGSSKWHNITVRQAAEARKIKEERDIQAIRASTTTLDKEKTKALSLSASPGAVSRSSNVGTLSNAGQATPTTGQKIGLSMFSHGKNAARGGKESEDEVSILREEMNTEDS